MGATVYHYTSIDTLKKILSGEKLRFTKMNSLNDKSEYKHGIQLLKNKIIEFENNNNIASKLNLDLLDRFSFCDKLYSLSFTENGDDLAFWNSYYVDKETPVSIGFIGDKIFNNDFIINRCIYGDPYEPMGEERYLWFTKIFDIQNIFQLPKNREYIHITFQTAHIKNKAFEIEKEWRAVNFGRKEGVFGKFNRNGKEVEYFDYNFNINSICEIILGPSKQKDINYQQTASLISRSKLNCLLRKSMIPLEL